MFEDGGRTDANKWTDATISSPCEPNGSGKLKTSFAEFDIVLYLVKVKSVSSFI